MTSVHIREDVSELDLGPSVEERLHTLQHLGLLSALDVSPAANGSID